MNGEMQQIEEENLDEEKRRFENCEGKRLVKWTCPNLGDVTEEKEMGWMPEKVDTVVRDSDGIEEKEMGWVSERVETIVVDSEIHKEELRIVEYDGEKVNSKLEKKLNGNFMWRLMNLYMPE